MFLKDEQWAVLEPVLRAPRRSSFGRPLADARRVFEVILFVLHTGIQWEHLPRTFPPMSAVHDYLRRWSEQHVFRVLLARVIRQLLQRGRLDLDQCFIDATFAPAKGGGEAVGLTRKGQGSKLQLVVDGQGVPLGVGVAAASTGEPQRVQGTLDLPAPDAAPARLVGDTASDSDPLDETLAELGIEMIAPHRANRRPENATQDGRPLRRCRHRWIVERTIARLGNHRRLLVRWEEHAHVFLSFTLLGCLMIALRHLPAIRCLHPHDSLFGQSLTS
ncbi:MAG: IS5 family transposase [Verrucomicrobiales bacterium]